MTHLLKRLFRGSVVVYKGAKKGYGIGKRKHEQIAIYDRNKRLKKAEIIKKIRESNLPPHLQSKEIHEISDKRFSSELKGDFLHHIKGVKRKVLARD